jgi:hypothetical protein
MPMFVSFISYRYDGLYKVEKAWMQEGLEGFLVCKYAFKVSDAFSVLLLLKVTSPSWVEA